MASAQNWAGVRQRVETVGARPTGRGVFGASGHEWTLEDPLSPGELGELEAQLGVRLPEEYRAFLLQVGAGGAGPAYGLFAVRRAQDRWRWEGDGADLTDPARLAEPFPDGGPDRTALDQHLALRPEEEDFDGTEGFDDAIEAWHKQRQALMFAPERTAGAIVISHLGCALRELLIISGSHRGTIWSDNRADDADLAPLLDGEGTPVTFARWYTEWLEQAERTALPAP